MNIVTTEIKELLLCENQSIAVDFTSFEEEVLFYDMGSIQMIWTGANATTAKLIPQASNDKVNWCDLLSDVQVNKVDSVNGCKLYTFPTLEYRYYRIKFLHMTNTAGTMTIISLLKQRRK